MFKLQQPSGRVAVFEIRIPKALFLIDAIVP